MTSKTNNMKVTFLIFFKYLSPLSLDVLLTWMNSNNSTGYFWRQSRIFNEVRSGQRKYTDAAWSEEQSVFLALSQISMRGSTNSERETIGVLAGMS